MSSRVQKGRGLLLPFSIGRKGRANLIGDLISRKGGGRKGKGLEKGRGGGVSFVTARAYIAHVLIGGQRRIGSKFRTQEIRKSLPLSLTSERARNLPTIDIITMGYVVRSESQLADYKNGTFREVSRHVFSVNFFRLLNSITSLSLL